MFSRPDGKAVRSSILDENPVGTAVRINGPYPDVIPLTTMPPQVLEVLPKLPKDLEYRFVGSRLILFDAHAHMVIDYVDNASSRSLIHAAHAVREEETAVHRRVVSARWPDPRSPGIVARATCRSKRLPRQRPCQEAPLSFPNRDGSLKFAVLGDFGTGGHEQYELAAQMAKVHARFPFNVVILLGDNLYGSQEAKDFAKKFEIPYKPLLDAGVKFYASLGNHDIRNQRNYKLFNMDGKLYYSFKAPSQDVRFFALESTYPVPEQIQWVKGELAGAREDWKIAFFHHPLYSSGERHGSDTRLRDTLEPLFLDNGVSVVFSGHDHFYERVKPQKGIGYFVVGSGGQLRTATSIGARASRPRDSIRTWRFWRRRSTAMS